MLDDDSEKPQDRRSSSSARITVQQDIEEADITVAEVTDEEGVHDVEIDEDTLSGRSSREIAVDLLHDDDNVENFETSDEEPPPAPAKHKKARALPPRKPAPVTDADEDFDLDSVAGADEDLVHDIQLDSSALENIPDELAADDGSESSRDNDDADRTTYGSAGGEDRDGTEARETKHKPQRRGKGTPEKRPALPGKKGSMRKGPPAKSTSGRGASGTRLASKKTGEDSDSGRASVAGKRPPAKGAASGKRPSAGGKRRPPHLTDEEIEERAAQAALSRKRNKQIWAACILVTLLSVAGAIYLLVFRETPAETGQPESQDARVFLNEIMRGNFTDDQLAGTKFADPAVFPPDLREKLLRGAPVLNATEPHKARELKAYIEEALSETIMKEHALTRNAGERWKKIKEAFRSPETSYHDEAIADLFEIKAELKLVQRYLELPENTPPETEIAAHGAYEKVLARAAAWLKEIGEQQSSKIHPEVGEARHRVVGRGMSDALCRRMRTAQTIGMHAEFGHEMDKYEAEDQEILAAEYEGYKARVTDQFAADHTAYIALVNERATKQRDSAVAARSEFKNQLGPYIASLEAYVAALKEAAKGAGIEGDSYVVGRFANFDKLVSDWHAKLDSFKDEA